MSRISGSRALFTITLLQLSLFSTAIKAGTINDKPESIIGYWQTTLDDNGSKLIFILKIEPTETDSLKCTIHLPEFGMSNLRYGNFMLQDDSVKLPGLKSILTNDKIKGIFSAQGPIQEVEFFKIKEKPRLSITCSEKRADWIYKTSGPIWSHPTIHEDQLLFGNDEGVFYSINLKDKSLSWSFRTEGQIKSRALAIDDGVLFASDDGNLYQLDLKSGAMKWKRDIGNAISPRIAPAKDAYDYDYLCSSPIQQDGMIYIGSKDSCLYAIDLVNGNVKWKYKTEGMIRSTPALDDDVVYVGSWDHYMYALKKEDGSLKWKYKTGWFIQSSPLIFEDKVIFGSRSAQIFALDN